MKRASESALWLVNELKAKDESREQWLAEGRPTLRPFLGDGEEGMRRWHQGCRWSKDANMTIRGTERERRGWWEGGGGGGWRWSIWKEPSTRHTAVCCLFFRFTRVTNPHSAHFTAFRGKERREILGHFRGTTRVDSNVQEGIAIRSELWYTKIVIRRRPLETLWPESSATFRADLSLWI